MIMLDNTTLPDDLVASSVVPGKGKDMATVSLEGGYDANFGGVTYQGDKIISWASCCSP